MSWYCFNCTLVCECGEMPGAVCGRGVKLSAVLGLGGLASFLWSHQQQSLCFSPPVEGALIRGRNKISWQLTTSHAIHTLVLCLPLSSLFSSQTVYVACRRYKRKKNEPFADLGSWLSLFTYRNYCELTTDLPRKSLPRFFFIEYIY